MNYFNQSINKKSTSELGSGSATSERVVVDVVGGNRFEGNATERRGG